jgi:hypothetical protein
VQRWSRSLPASPFRVWPRPVCAATPDRHRRPGFTVT